MNPKSKLIGAIVVVGDEIVRGEDQDTNYRIAASMLQGRDVSVIGGSIVRDEKDEIIEAINRDVDMGANLIVVSGGIGSTHDDVTREAVAKWANRHLEINEKALEQTQGFEGTISSGSEDNQAKVKRMLEEMGKVPEGSRIVENPSGINPGFIVEDEALVIVLPGVPLEFESTLEVALAELGMAEVKVYRREIKLNLPEAFYADALRKTAIKFPDVSVGSYPKLESANQIRFRSLNEDSLKDAVDIFFSQIKLD